MRPALLLAALATAAFPLLALPAAGPKYAPASASAQSAEPLVPDAFPSTYEPLPSEPVLIRNATILTGDGSMIEGGSILLRDAVIAAIGTDVPAPAGVRVIEADGRWVTPGLIVTHSHLGNYPSPGISSQSDGNELTDPNTGFQRVAPLRLVEP